ncbi:MAG: hypothetical protein GY820_32120 [Gammaproteobacteria bacterium]|nr:hypothetical protein [Gammaproteobacteria bacterium]
MLWRLQLKNKNSAIVLLLESEEHSMVIRCVYMPDGSYAFRLADPNVTFVPENMVATNLDLVENINMEDFYDNLEEEYFEKNPIGVLFSPEEREKGQSPFVYKVGKIEQEALVGRIIAFNLTEELQIFIDNIFKNNKNDKKALINYLKTLNNNKKNFIKHSRYDMISYYCQAVLGAEQLSAKDKLALLLPWRDTLYDALACGDIKFANFYINSVLEEKNFSWQEKVSLFFDVLKKDKRWLEFYKAISMGYDLFLMPYV